MNIALLNEELSHSVDLIVRNQSTIINQRTRLKEILASMGYYPTEEVRETIQDFFCHARLNFMVTFNVYRALGFRNWVSELNQAALDINPARELICSYSQQNRSVQIWIDRWNLAKESLGSASRASKAHRTHKAGEFNARALVTDLIWGKISRFGLPYPPFDFNTDFNVVIIGRDEAVASELMDDDQNLVSPNLSDFQSPPLIGFDADLSNISKELIKWYG